jgi:DNA (cytosine-5)-methyltransferase 1
MTVYTKLITPSNPKLDGFTHHETRSHMRSDIHRYLFASSFAKAANTSPKLPDFPPNLLPNHENATDDDAPFTDRFRVQLPDGSSSTVVSHIAKDGHHFIHYDPSQCRSLTVREAARLQTFPDDYFFEGTRTQQYTQVGNAVPPWLARKIATVVLNFLTASRKKPTQKKRRS